MAEILRVQPSSLMGFLQHSYSSATICNNLRFYFAWVKGEDRQPIPLSKFKQYSKWDKSEDLLEVGEMDHFLGNVIGVGSILLPKKVKLPTNIQRYAQHLISLSKENTVRETISCSESTIRGAIKGSSEACEAFYLAARGCYHRRDSQFSLIDYVSSHKITESPGIWSLLFSCCFPQEEKKSERYRSDEELALLKGR